MSPQADTAPLERARPKAPRTARPRRSSHPPRPRARASTPAPARPSKAARLRVLDAAARLSFERPHDALSARDVIAASGVAPSAFYALFDSKRACVEAALEAALAGLAERVEAARSARAEATGPSPRSWREGVGATLGALARDLSAEPRLAHLVVVVGSELRCRAPRLDPVPRLLSALDAPAAPGPRDPRLAAAAGAAAKAAVWDLLLGEARAGRAGTLEGRVDELALAALCPFVGTARARGQAAELAARARRGDPPQRPWTLHGSGLDDPAERTVARLRAVRTAGDLRHADLARALGVNTRTISRWLADETAPTHEAELRAAPAIQALECVVDALPGRAAREWLLTPNPGLDGGAPLDLLGAGAHARARGALEALGNGGAS